MMKIKILVIQIILISLSVVVLPAPSNATSHKPTLAQIEEGYVVFHENKDELKGVYVLILQYLMETRAKLKNFSQ